MNDWKTYKGYVQVMQNKFCTLYSRKESSHPTSIPLDSIWRKYVTGIQFGIDISPIPCINSSRTELGNIFVILYY